MRGDPADHSAADPTVFVTHSTHKLVAALSQTAYIHVETDGALSDPRRFNEAYASKPPHRHSTR